MQLIRSDWVDVNLSEFRKSITLVVISCQLSRTHPAVTAVLFPLFWLIRKQIIAKFCRVEMFLILVAFNPLDLMHSWSLFNLLGVYQSHININNKSYAGKK